MSDGSDSLSLFDPVIARWFSERVGTPTEVQAAAWPLIAAGEHVVVTAPTGSGKTLTAFLWALNQLLTGALPAGQCSVLYVSPLKALNNDIQRNLLGPLEDLREAWPPGTAALQGTRPPGTVALQDIRVMTRSGDTPGAERRRMLRRPPEILITTPESLNLLLSSAGGISLLGHLRCVILDEVHAVIGGARGAHLMSAVERLVPLCGEFQRIALSATVRPLESVAAFVGGYRRLDGTAYGLRSVRQIESHAKKAYAVDIRFPESVREADGERSIWPRLVGDVAKELAGARSTLIFANSRRLAETLTWRINDEAQTLVAYAHHGSLAREIRREVERRLKAGELKAIVATSSLELGIDIGALDRVVLVQSPTSVSSAIQRLGRAGHCVGETSRGTLYVTHPADLLQGAVVLQAALNGDIEPIHAPRAPLDVLAQVLISMTGTATWPVDELYAEIRRSWTFHELSRKQFDLVLAMLAGRYARTRLRELTPRLSWDAVEGTVAARPGALQALYTSGGTIPDRGYFHLRHAETAARIGDLDEEYVWEARVGQTLTFGTQTWRIERITHNDVFAIPAGQGGREAPFWKAEERSRDVHLSERLLDFLEMANGRLDDPTFPADLQATYHLDARAGDALVGYLRRQREATGCDLPHRRHVVIEHTASGPEGQQGTQVILHTGWGRTVNRPLALALTAAWEERTGARLEAYAADDAVYLVMAQDVPARDLLPLVTPDRLEALLRKELEGSGHFGARFRECAGRALLLGKQKPGERLPLWVSRLRSKRLLDTVRRYEDFPIVLEAWRTCLQDDFDLDALRQLLDGLETGAIAWSEAFTDAPSPFAGTMAWRQINQYMYADDTPVGGAASRLRPDLLREVLFTPDLRPVVPGEVVRAFEEKRQRLAAGYAPGTPREIAEWLKERVLLPEREWRALLGAIARDHGTDEAAVTEGLGEKVVTLHMGGTPVALVVAAERREEVEAWWSAGGTDTRTNTDEHGRTRTGTREQKLEDEDAALRLGEWLRFYGPLTPGAIGAALGIAQATLDALLEDLADTQVIVRGRLQDDVDEDTVCDAENFATLLRLARTARVPEIVALPVTDLPLFLAQHGGLAAPGAGPETTWRALQRLAGFTARAGLWEEAFLPARVRDYAPAWLDGLMQERGLMWIGAGVGQVTYCTEEDLPLLHPHRPVLSRGPVSLFSDDPHARYPLSALAMKSSGPIGDLVAHLWAGVWEGVISNDAAATLRRGIEQDFKAPSIVHEGGDKPRPYGRRPSRGDFNRWSSALPASGNWYRVPDVPPPADALEADELAKDRARLLLDRYGVLCRELLEHEPVPLQWPTVFRALRLMELAGEVVEGYFFQGVPGPQFASHEAVSALRHGLRRDSVWWINACDPASLCGTALEGLRGTLPRRVPGNWIAFLGADPALIVQRDGRDLDFRLPPAHPRLGEVMGVLDLLLERRIRPARHLEVETINGARAARSPYREALSAAFDVVPDVHRLFLAPRCHPV